MHLRAQHSASVTPSILEGQMFFYGSFGISMHSAFSLLIHHHFADQKKLSKSSGFIGWQGNVFLPLPTDVFAQPFVSDIEILIR